VLSKVQAGDVLFIDECHRMTSMTEEMLGLAMMPPYTFVIPPASQLSGAEERPVTMAPWTCIGATTVYGKITKPLRDRMALTVQLKPYGAADMSEILRRAAQRLDIEINEESRLALASAVTALHVRLSGCWSGSGTTHSWSSPAKRSNP